MKRDELNAYKADVTIPVYGTIADAEVYLKEKVDAIIAEKDAEIAELESRIPVWHKFSEETPKHHQDILCYCPRAKYCKVALRRWDEGTRFDVFNQELYTHWMRLPEELTEDKIFTIKQ